MDQDKLFISTGALLADSYRLAMAVLRSGFKPTHIAGIWRGGALPAIAVEEALRYHGVAAEPFPVRTRAYTGIGETRDGVAVDTLETLSRALDAHSRLLIVDDVFDRGHSLAALIEALKAKCGASMPQTVKTACVWYKPARNETASAPDFYIHETARWLVFPHELIGLSAEEIAANKPVPGDFLDIESGRQPRP